MIATKKKLEKTLIKTDGNVKEAAKKIGVSPQAIYERLDRDPKIKERVESAKELAMRKAGLTRVKVYKVIADGLNAKALTSFEGKIYESKFADYKERRESAKLSVQLFGDLANTQPEGGDIYNSLFLNLNQINLESKDIPIGDLIKTFTNQITTVNKGTK